VPELEHTEADLGAVSSSKKRSKRQKRTSTPVRKSSKPARTSEATKTKAAATSVRRKKRGASKKSRKRNSRSAQQFNLLKWSVLGLVSLVMLAGAVFYFQPGAGAPTQTLVAAESGEAVHPASFQEDIQPFFQKYCIDCHGPDGAEAEINFANYQKQSDIKANRETWEKILKLVKVGAMPPADADQPNDDEKRELTGWLDHELFYVDCSKPDPGRVTVHRLNRTEYNNTVRDLLGVNFEPAEDFPSDDVGYGFDNIGDVLTVPPLLIEKYLAAAEQVSQKSLLLRHVDYTDRLVQGKQLKHVSGSPGYEGSVGLPSSGQVFHEFEFPANGRYQIVIESAASQAGEELAKAKVTIDGADVKTVSIRGHLNFSNYEMVANVKKGKKVVSAAFINDFYDPKASGRKDRNLYIKSISIEGPLGAPELSPNAARLLATVPKDGTTAKQAAAANLREFLPRAFRRSVTSDEIDKYASFTQMSVDHGETFEEAMQVTVQAILVSPDFLFRAESGTRQQNNIETIDDEALASRLSYFLWSSMPDDELFELAKSGKLHEPDVLKQQIHRMLSDRRSNALIANFPGQWLGLRKLTTNEIAPDPKVFPDFDNQLRKDFWKETELFFDHIVRNDASIYDLLTGKYTYLNERLSKFYGLGNVEGDQFKKVSLDNQPRMGVLTQGSILTLTSYPTRTSPVRRGQWVLENLLGDAPPEAPPLVPGLEETQKSNPNISFREQLELHRSDPNCASCHKLMDGIGFGLQNFDGIGKWRTKEGQFDVDATGTLPSGEAFEGPEQLIAILDQRKEKFGRCVAEKLLTYAVGRGVEYYDKCAIDGIMEQVEQDDRFSSLVMAIVNSAPFQNRRIEPSE